MIRRWSCLINLNNNFSRISTFKKNYKINLFKSSVNFKRFTFKITKFKRKTLLKFKHRANWLIYTNVLKYWVVDYMFNKIYYKYQILNRIFLNNFYFYNFNFIKNRNETFFYNFNFIFFTLTNKKIFYFNKESFYFKNSPMFSAIFFKNPNINNSVVPVYSSWDNCLYDFGFFSKQISKNNFNFDVDLIFDFLFNFFSKKIIEIRKIIVILFHFNLNFKKLNKFVFKII